MSRYFYPGPYAGRPVNTGVPPAWSPPAPVGLVRFPASPEPGARFVMTERELYWPGGRDALGVPLQQVVRGYSPQEGALVRYAGIKDRNMWGSHMPEPQPVVFMGELPRDITIYKGSMSLASDVDMDEDDDFGLDDEGLMEDLMAVERVSGSRSRAGRLGSRSARGSRAQRDAVLMDALGVTQEDIDFVEAYGAPAMDDEGETPSPRTVKGAMKDFFDKAKRSERRAKRDLDRATMLARLSEERRARSKAQIDQSRYMIEAQQATEDLRAANRAEYDSQMQQNQLMRARSGPLEQVFDSASSAAASASEKTGLSTPAMIGIAAAAAVVIGAGIYYVRKS